MKEIKYKTGDIVKIDNVRIDPDKLCTVFSCTQNFVKVFEYVEPFSVDDVRRVEIDADFLKKIGFSKAPFFPSKDICFYWKNVDDLISNKILLSRNSGDKHWDLNLFSPKGDVYDFECDYLDEIQTLVDLFDVPLILK